MEELKDRRLKYSRAEWLPGFIGNTLEHYVKQSHDLLDTVKKRTFSYNRMEMQGLRYKIIDGFGIFAHVAAYIPGQDTSLVADPSPKPQVDTDTTSPPAGKNFMEGDIFFLVSGNHIILCPSDVHEAVVHHYIMNVLCAVGFNEAAHSFAIEKIVNCDKVQLLRDEGVKKISLDMSLYKASIDHIERKTMKTSLLSSISKEVMALFGDDEDLKSIQEHENIHMRLVLSYDKRMKGGIVGQERLEKTAERIINEEEHDGVTIETLNGNTMTPGELRISKKISLVPRGKSVDCDDAWRKIQDYYRELKGSGVLEQ